MTEHRETDRLVPLAYERLDTHRDTEELAAEFAFDETWQAHLECLRALHPTGREALARRSLQRQT
ncbi:MAG: hypothetical protein JO243_20200 [Solirubrobacterales bacterium]|nr:hypothetical protein [Solirubrobacterales bacterium]